MNIDLCTLVVVGGFVVVVSGLILLFSWWLDRRSACLGLWGGGLILLAAGYAVIAARGALPLRASIEVGSALCLLANGLMWCGARSFVGRPIRLAAVLAGALVWVVACQFDALVMSVTMRQQLFSLITVVYTLLTAWEYLRSAEVELASRWPAVLLLAAHAILFLARVVFPYPTVFPNMASERMNVWLTALAAVLLAHYLSMAFLVLCMVKERRELEHRREARIDELTGIANRRAFFESGEPLLRGALAERRPVALLTLDLDLFKSVNDTFGHGAGDRVLRAFCDTVVSLLRPGDLFGRTGGEEFALLLPDADGAAAMKTAERIRAAFADRQVDVGGARAAATVSIGVALARPDDDFAALMAASDGALYRAKAAGRNRVVWACAPTPCLGFTAAA
ncbi:GGDEF domain-containing protein [Xanthobacteraceae bacterium Astr-EGSB]|uniref:GGDEF domain-containing protein n=1 Tax=Astrobacterium formosum TaxID=3069710 RepID=UPI0027B58B3A|nr:GGDEF domain-containing protein [Xanthobacteraceae bacterium Astr-EGSB]